MNRFVRLAAAAAFTGLTGLASATAAPYTGLYVLGDSLSDAGNLAAIIGSNPSQVITGNSYIPGQPYASGQFTNGNVWAQTFANLIGLPGYGASSFTGGANIAFGGARTAGNGDVPFDFDNDGINDGLPPSLATQTRLFLNYGYLLPGGAQPGGVLSGTALYVVAGGGNDARDALQAAATSATPSAMIGAAALAYAQNIGAIVDSLQGAGAQHIIVWDVPNLALAPAVTAQGAQASFVGGLVSQAMNGALAARLAGESGVKLFDLYGFQNQLTANPGAYGLTNVTDACGAAISMCDPATALFWDGIHPTAAGHALLAQQMFITAVPEPQTWALLAAGLLLVGLRTQRRAAQAQAQAEA
jgi:phospholipase/lecithinase/hemolysin